MGCCLSRDINDSLSKEIDTMLFKDYTERKYTVNVLLLGTGSSGKSTFVKNMRILNSKSFTDEEIMHFKKIIEQNLLDSMKLLLEQRSLSNFFNDPFSKDYKKVIMGMQNLHLDSVVFLEIVDHFWTKMKQLKNSNLLIDVTHSSIGSSIKHSAPPIDTMPYFLDRARVILDSSYVPSEQDILAAREQTKNIKETIIEVDENLFRFIDVGGQKSERHKWIKCFSEALTVVVYVVSLSDYNKYFMDLDAPHKRPSFNKISHRPSLLHDRKSISRFNTRTNTSWPDMNSQVKRNRLVESIELFNVLLNIEDIKNVNIVLLLNKSDLFDQKITRIPLSHHFADYKGPDFNRNFCLDFIKKKFVDQNTNPRRKIYTHITNSLDICNMAKVWADTKRTIVELNLRMSNLL